MQNEKLLEVSKILKSGQKREID